MRIGIDASNIREGGGLTHIAEVLRAAEPHRHGVSRVIFWAGAKTLERIHDRPWLEKVHQPLLDRSLPLRRLWQRFLLEKLARQKGCDLLFCPGGSYTGSFRPFVAMSQNLLPFDWSEARRYGMSLKLLKLMMIRRSQASAFREANSLIYLSAHAAQTIRAATGSNRPYAVIPHGIGRDFFAPPRPQRKIENCSNADPFRILYVSTITVFKHHDCVAEAVVRLRREGIPATLDIVGPAYRPSMKRLQRLLGKADPGGMFIRCLGEIPHSSLATVYRRSELFVYASSCENMPNILLEAMASGLPIACSNRGPMPEMLRDAGVYFDPESSGQVTAALRKLILNRARRKECSALAYRYAGAFSWDRCANDILAFLAGSAAGEAQTSTASPSRIPKPS